MGKLKDTFSNLSLLQKLGVGALAIFLITLVMGDASTFFLVTGTFLMVIGKIVKTTIQAVLIIGTIVMCFINPLIGIVAVIGVTILINKNKKNAK